MHISLLQLNTELFTLSSVLSDSACVFKWVLILFPFAHLSSAGLYALWCTLKRLLVPYQSGRTCLLRSPISWLGNKPSVVIKIRPVTTVDNKTSFERRVPETQAGDVYLEVKRVMAISWVTQLWGEEHSASAFPWSPLTGKEPPLGAEWFEPLLRACDLTPGASSNLADMWSTGAGEPWKGESARKALISNFRQPWRNVALVPPVSPCFR